jgi:hypothetical protein
MSSIRRCAAGRPDRHPAGDGAPRTHNPCTLHRARPAELGGLALVLIVALGACRPAPAATGPSASAPAPTPTIDRLAAPTLPPSPAQADLGAYAFWEYCLPCHGDRGQGLTDEFRELYPPEDRNCWDAGCHGPRPYENGWTLPASVPALVGPGRLARFSSAAELQAFVQAAMPWHNPGSLDETTTWQITAHLLRSNGITLPPENLGPLNAGQILLLHAPVAGDPSEASGPEGGRYRVAFVVLGILLMLGAWARLEQKRKNSPPEN